MNNDPIVIEKVYNSAIDRVWKAITDKDQIKQWFADMVGFKPEVGAEFHFEGKDAGVVYDHSCKILELIPNKKLSYSFSKGGQGNTLVSFELVAEGKKTKLTLTHSGFETFPQNNPAFARSNFFAGWSAIIGKRLMELVEADSNSYHVSISVNVTAKEAFDGICRVSEWWTGNLDGSSRELNDVFTTHHNDDKTFVTMKLTELIPDKMVVWEVTDCFLDWLGDKTEWKNTRLIWNISVLGDSTSIHMTHAGLAPEIECYNDCRKGWDFYVKESLYKLLTEGKGLPEKK